MDSDPIHDLSVNTDHEDSDNLQDTDPGGTHTKEPDHWNDLQEPEELANWTSTTMMKPEPANMCWTS